MNPRLTPWATFWRSCRGFSWRVAAWVVFRPWAFRMWRPHGQSTGRIDRRCQCCSGDVLIVARMNFGGQRPPLQGMPKRPASGARTPLTRPSAVRLWPFNFAHRPEQGPRGRRAPDVETFRWNVSDGPPGRLYFSIRRSLRGQDLAAKSDRNSTVPGCPNCRAAGKRALRWRVSAGTKSPSAPWLPGGDP